VRGNFHEAVTISAIHSQLGDMNIVWKGHGLGRLVSYLCVLRRGIIPSGRCYPARDYNDADDHFERQPVRPAWKEVSHRLSGLHANAALSPSPPGQIRPMATYEWMEIVLRICFVQTAQKG
jgi:hypothetical protein